MATAQSTDSNNIPQELRDLNIWHCWRDNNGVKLPVQINGESAKSNNPETWTDFESAMDASLFIGGLALEIVEPYCGIDLDDCLDERGNLRGWAIGIVSRFDGLAFMEVSPSGKGIKLITRGRKPTGSRCRHNFQGKQQVECYDNRRFWTVTGDVYSRQTDIGDGQQAVDWLCGEYLKSKQVSSVPAPRAVAPGLGTSLLSRARSYIESVPYQGGGRNNAIFSLAGHLRSLVGDVGERISEAEILELVQSWNSGLGEPLGGQEVENAVASSGRNGTARADKLPGVPLMTFPAVDLSGLIDERPFLPDKECSMLSKSNLPEELCFPPGFISDAVEHQMGTTEYQCPEFFLAAAISTVSALTGRKVTDYRGTMTNTYQVCLGLTGSGKERGRRFIQDVLADTNLVVADKFTSESAIANQLEITPSCVSLSDEFGKYVEAACRKNGTGPLADVAAAMMSLFTSRIWSPKQFADQARAVTINQPCLSIYGTSTPSTFFAGLSGGDVDSGFLNRMLIFQSPGGGYTKRQRFRKAPIPNSLRDFVDLWVNTDCGPGNLSPVNPTPKELGISTAATNRLEQHFDAISEKRIGEDLVSAAFWSRTSEKTSRLALIAATSRGSDSIGIEDADWAIAVANFLTRRTIAMTAGNIASTPHELNMQKLMKIITDNQGIIGITQLGKKSRFLPARQRNEILNQFLECGELITVVKRTKGRVARGVALNLRTIKDTEWIPVTAEMTQGATLSA